MESFETKARDYYGEVVINKGLMGKAGFGARASPVYVGEWIISQFLENGEIDASNREKITSIVTKYLPQKADKNRLLNDLKDHKPVQILDDFRVTVNLDKNTHELSIPVLDESHALIQKPILDTNPMLLRTGMWGLGTLQYVPPDGDEIKKGQIWMTDFKPFQTPGVDLEYFTSSRKHFTLDEWIDLLISSCQFNPECHTLPQKMLLLSRVIPLVQPRVNLVELAPKGTGKSFVFDNISRYAAVIPGGKLSAPSLFFNSSSRQIGLIPRYDVVVVDEIQKIQTDSAGEAMAGLKMYLESGRYRRATGDMGTSEAGFVMLGNITLTTERRPLFQTEGLFKELPPALQESAFIDRLHGLLEGWFMPRITKNTPSRHLGLKGDFFGEVLHELRPGLEFADYVSHSLRLPSCDDMRDNKAIARIAEGYLKLLFPDLTVTEEQFIEYCVNPALRMRQQIRDELSKIDPEYSWVSIRSAKPDDFQLLHPSKRPAAGPGALAAAPEIEAPVAHETPISEMIRSGESSTVEFKSLLRVNLHTNRPDPQIEHAVLKTLAAFLNTHGGILIIGIDDKGAPLGLEKDGFQSEDKMDQHLANLIRDRLGPHHTFCLHPRFGDYEGKRVLVVRCDPAKSPVYLKDGKNEYFYIRVSGTTSELSASRIHDYVKQRFSL
jgi:ATP-dependent Lon protease